MNNLLLIKLLAERKQMQCELMAVKCNRDEWKTDAQRLRAESGGLLNDLR